MSQLARGRRWAPGRKVASTIASPALAAAAAAIVSLAPGCSREEAAEEPVVAGAAYSPDTVHRTARGPGARGLLDRRGLIHAHSVYSHDACDDAPRDPETGAVNEPCFDDFRRDLCKVQHDFVMLTDHRDSFSSTEFPDTLLYRPDRGDRLVERGGDPVASWAACPGAEPTLIMAGCEAETMPVGLERHVAPDGERSDVYGTADAASIERLKQAGAVALVAHTETWTVDQLATLPLDGFEMFNLHANLFAGIGAAVPLLANRESAPELLPASDLVLLPIVSEDPAYVNTWGSVLARGVRRVTTMATDCHRNSFPQLLPDGERIDSYRRMMRWFSNHLLVRPKSDGTWDDADLKEALRAGRLYGAFEVLGYPTGFDFHADQAGGAVEMGGEASIGAGTRLRATLPHVEGLGASRAPEIDARVLRAREGGWDEVVRVAGDVDLEPTLPGAYRVEIRIEPHHLEPFLSSYAALADKDFVWVYSNPIYVVE